MLLKVVGAEDLWRHPPWMADARGGGVKGTSLRSDEASPHWRAARIGHSKEEKKKGGM